MKKQNLTIDFDKRIGWFLFALAVLLYINTLGHQYVLDDEALLVNNSLTESGLSHIGKIFSTGYRATLHTADTELYRPLPKLIFAIYWAISPGNPFLPHLINVLLYALCVFMLYKVSKQTLALSRETSFLASLLFCIHPIHTEVVANSKSLDELLCLLFALFAWDALGKKHQAQGKQLLWGYLAFFLSLLSKESGIMLALVLPAFLILHLGVSRIDVLKRVAGMVVVAVVFIFIRFQVTGWQVAAPDASVNYLVMINATGARILEAFYLLAIYLYKMLLPYKLVSDASFAAFKPMQGIDYLMLLLPLMLLAALVLAWRHRARYTLAAAGLFMILLYWFPVSNIPFLIGTQYAERFMFMPSLGLAFVLAQWVVLSVRTETPKAGITYLGVQGIGKQMMMAVYIVSAVAALAVISRNADWKTNKTLFDADIEKEPESARLQCYYANAHTADIYLAGIKDQQKLQAEVSKGMAAYEKAIQILPGFHQAYESLADLCAKVNERDRADSFFRMAIQLKPGHAPYYNNYGNFLFVQQQANRALPYFEKALSYDSTFAEAWNNKGSVLASRAKNMLPQNIAINQLKQISIPDSAQVLFQNALQCFEKAMTLNQALAEPCLYASMVYTTLSNEEAAAQMQTEYNKRKQANARRMKLLVKNNQ